MNEFFEGGMRPPELNGMYYWDQFHPILSAVAILLIGWILALIIAAGIKKLLEKLETNLRFSVHKKTKQIMIKIIDTKTEEVIKELPPEKLLDMVASMMERAGLIIDKKG